MDNVNYRVHCTALDLNPEEEFTWWNHYTVDEYLSSSKYYDFILPNEIDSEKYDILLSFGRKLKYLYYYERDFIYDSDYALEEGYRARPIFEMDYKK